MEENKPNSDKEKTPKGSITPDFLYRNGKNDEEDSGGLLKKAEDGAIAGAAMAGMMSKKGGGDKKAGGGDGGIKNSVIGRRKSKKKDKSGKKFNLKNKAKAFIIPILIFAMLFLGAILIGPLVTVGSIDEGLQDTIGVEKTTELLELKAEYVTEEQLTNGKINSEYARNLEDNNILVGQVTASGDFVRTNNYIADLDNREIATNGLVYNNNNGELAVLFDDQVITADNFVATLESNPKMYAAYSKALNIATRFYYSDEVDEVYDSLKMSRNNFANWERGSTKEQSRKNFNEIFESVMNGSTDINFNSYNKDNDQTYSSNFSNYKNGQDLIEDVSNNVKGEDATKRAASLVNTIVSTNEPYRAAKMFGVVEEVIQCSKIENGCPVDEVMDMLSEKNTTSVYDIEGGEEKEEKGSILDSKNFLASFSGAKFSKEEANNYSRDRINKIIGGNDKNIVNDTAVSKQSTDKRNILVKLFGGSGEVDKATLGKASSSIKVGSEDPVKDLKSKSGGEKILEGGSFLINSINKTTLGAMPSDANTILSYHDKLEEVSARRAEAEKATRSPFDITSKYTFLGSIARKISSAVISSNNLPDFDLLKTTSSVFSVAKESASDIVGVASAKSRDSFLETNGDCYTPNSSANTEGDLFCNEHDTVSTKYIKYGLEDFKKSNMSDSINDDGSVKDNSDFAEFISLGSDREAIAGVESSEVCERYKDFDGNQSILEKITDALTSALGLYQSCQGVESEIATGAYYTLSDSNSNRENIELYSSYTLYQTVSSLISDAKNEVTAYRQRYYKEHPLDESESGILARRTGLEKSDVLLAIEIIKNMNRIARYNPIGRYDFTKHGLGVDRAGFIFYDNKKEKENAVPEGIILARKKEDYTSI